MPDDVEEFWSEIRPSREPAAKKEASKEAFQRGLQGLTASSSADRALQELTGGMDLDYRDRGNQALRRELEEEGAEMLDFEEAVQEVDSDAREPFNTGMGRATFETRSPRVQEEAQMNSIQRAALGLLDEARVRPLSVSGQIAEARRALDGGSPGFQSAVQEAAQVARIAHEADRRETRSPRPDIRDRNPQILQRALEALGFPASISLTIDGSGNRLLNITPEAGSSVYLNGLAIIITRSV